MPSSSWDAAGGRTVMLLPLCLWWDGVAVPGIMEAPANGPSIGNLGPTWAPGLTLILSHAKAQMVQDWCSQLLCFITDGEKSKKNWNKHFIF